MFSSFCLSTSSVLLHCWHLLGKSYRDYYHCRGRINFLLSNCTFSAFTFIRGFLALLLSPWREATQDTMIISWQVWHLVQDFWMVQGSRFSLLKQKFLVVTSQKNAKDLSDPLSIPWLASSFPASFKGTIWNTSILVVNYSPATPKLISHQEHLLLRHCWFHWFQTNCYASLLAHRMLCSAEMAQGISAAFFSLQCKLPSAAAILKN